MAESPITVLHATMSTYLTGKLQGWTSKSGWLVCSLVIDRLEATHWCDTFEVCMQDGKTRHLIFVMQLWVLWLLVGRGFFFEFGLFDFQYFHQDLTGNMFFSCMSSYLYFLLCVNSFYPPLLSFLLLILVFLLYYLLWMHCHFPSFKNTNSREGHLQTSVLSLTYRWLKISY